MNHKLKPLLLLLSITLLQACITDEEPPAINLQYADNHSPTYDEVIEYYRALADHYPAARLLEAGDTDVGKPLHIFMMSGDELFDPAAIKANGQSIVLINNGIHAGEPAGVDASLRYAGQLLAGKDGLDDILEQTVIAIIPVYNIGGLLNRSPYHRMNQDGPEYKGGRRNARNLDLNRDFAKQDSRNALSFADIFQLLDPDIFLDTHTTNGIEHESVMTLIPTLHNHLADELATFFREEMTPSLYRRMNAESPHGAIPYLHRPSRGDIRDGIAAFNDHPDYSSGYAALYNTPGFITETQFAKPYPERVEATYDFISLLADYTATHTKRIRELRQMAKDETANQRDFVLDRTLNMEQHDSLLFKGYETSQATAPLTGRPVTTYDYDSPLEVQIPFFNTYDATLTVTAPEAYIVPQAWHEVIRRLELNGVEITRLGNDTVLEVETMYIREYETASGTTQGRQRASLLETDKVTGPRQFYEGDAVIHTNQHSNNYIVHMLEPEAPSSFFSWGFFNAALEDGEWWWIFGFEDYAYQQLQEDEQLRAAFRSKKEDDKDFADDPRAMLEFILNYITREETERGWHLYPVASFRAKS